MNWMRLRAATCVVAIAALIACAAASPAMAAGKPQITAAGIDAADRIVATWTLPPGTTLDSINIASSSIIDEGLQQFEDTDNDAGNCDVEDCSATQTSYRGSDPVSRDRRYFVFVTAKAGTKLLPSEIWVIDETKPLIPGEGRPSARPTNTPVLGRPYVPPAPETIPQPRLSLPATNPKTIAGFMRRGIRTRLTCPIFECWTLVVLDLDGTTSVLDSATIRPDGRRTFVLRPTKALNKRLRVRSRARLKLTVYVHHPGGKATEITRRISLRR